MKTINNYINEKLKIGKTTKQQYTCQPKDKYELRKILEVRLAEDKDADLNDIDVSKITDMSIDNNDNFLFEDLDPHNIDISQWDVSNVKDMGYMFYRCKNFNCDLSGWDVSNVENMEDMFCGCEKFDSDLSGWDVTKVIDMSNMFYNCKNFKGDGIEKWDVSNIENMSYMFIGCISIKKLPKWFFNNKI